jgi:hypothetical protein
MAIALKEIRVALGRLSVGTPAIAQPIQPAAAIIAIVLNLMLCAS